MMNVQNNSESRSFYKLNKAFDKSVNRPLLEKSGVIFHKRVALEKPEEFLAFAKVYKALFPEHYNAILDKTKADRKLYQEVLNDKGVTYTLKRIVKSHIIHKYYRFYTKNKKPKCSMFESVANMFEKFGKKFKK
ncbi:MAG: hypothetical protein LKG27_00780 [Clostridiaceae bacterium]|jgi:hypothetical protein|nr:hypothetical protein [Clostridiaceae bacterium]